MKPDFGKEDVTHYLSYKFKLSEFIGIVSYDKQIIKER
jgi:hypothetical protein